MVAVIKTPATPIGRAHRKDRRRELKAFITITSIALRPRLFMHPTLLTYGIAASVQARAQRTPVINRLNCQVTVPQVLRILCRLGVSLRGRSVRPIVLRRLYGPA